MPVTIDELEIQIQDNAKQAASGLDVLIAAMERLRSATSGNTGLARTASNLERISRAVAAVQSSHHIGQLAENLQKLQGVGKLNLTSTLGQLEKVPKIMASLKTVDFGLDEGSASGMKQTLESLALAVEPLQKIEKSNLGPTLTQLGKIPDIMKNLDSADLGKFADQMQRVATAVRPLASEMDKVAKGFAAFPSRIQKLITQNEKLTASNSKLSKSYGIMGTGITKAQFQMGALYLILKKAASTVGKWIDESTAYIENVNLFSASMGKYADAAGEYAQKVQDAVGIDLSEWIRNQGVFREIAGGFGLAEDAAYSMSKTLTQLGYDLSSYWNIPIETAMQKLQSGITGQVEPLRALGISLTQTSLEQTALNLGITQSISTMTEAQKAQLRYVTILEKSKNALGDMSRTLITPANAMRILEQQTTQLSRALGNLFIPLLIKIIPYVQAFVMVLTEAIQALAALFGFELPKIDYSGISDATGSVGDLEDTLGGASSKAKELKGQLAGFDQLNIIASESGGGAGGGAGGGTGADWGLDLSKWDYDFLGDAANKAKELAEQMREALDWVILIGAGIAAWKLAEAVKDMGMFAKLLASAAVITLEFIFVKKFTDDFFQSGNIGDLIKALIVTAIGSGFLYALWGPAGLAIGIGVGIVAMLTSMYFNIKDGTAQIGDFKTKVVSGLVTALSGIAGMAVAAATGGSIGAGGLIGLTIGAALTLTIGNMAAVAGGQQSLASAETIIYGLLSSLFAGVAGLLILGGPSGFVIGLTIGIVLNVASLALAVQEQIKQNAIDTFFDGQGETIDRLTESYSSLMRSIVDTNQPIIDAWQSISDGKESIQNTTDEIYNFTKQIDMGVLSATEGLPKIEEAFQDLYDETGELLTNLANNIYTALAGSTGEGITAAGFNLDELGRIIKSTTDSAQQDLGALKQANEDLMAAIKSGTADSDAWDKLIENASRISEIAGTSKPEIDAFSDTLKNIIPKDINWNSVEEAGAAFTNMADATKAAKDSIAGSSDVLIAEFEEIRRLATEYSLPVEDIKLLDGVVEYLKTSKDTKLAEIDSALASFLGGVQANIINEMGAQTRAAMEEWNNKTDVEQWLSGFFGPKSEQEFVESQLSAYRNNIINPIGEGIEKAFGSILGEGVNAVSGISSDVLAEFFTYTPSSSDLSHWTVAYSSTISGAIQTALGKATTQTKTDAVPLGEATDSGMAKGISDNARLVIDAMASMLNDVDLAAMTALDANSPSEVYAEKGLFIDQGIEKGILDNKGLPVAAMRTTLDEVNDIFKTFDFTSGLNNMFNKMLTSLETFSNRFQNGIQSMLKNVASAMNSVQASSGGTVTVPSISKVTIPKYAAGGFPEDGFFFANSTELVGKFANGKTAVANNEQIEAGIQAGVEKANEKSDALMRELIEIGKKILAKDLTLPTGALAGRWIDTQKAEYDKMRGAT